MSDLLLPIFLYVTASAGAAMLGWQIARRGSRRLATGMAALVVLGLLVSALLLADHPLWARVLPVENVWLYANPTLPGASLLAGLVFRLLPPVMWQRMLLVIVLVALGVQRSLSVLYGARPSLSAARWSGETCRQSTKSTCAPAAAASALRVVGISATEADLAAAAFSVQEGTSNLTLYRALRRATAGSAITVCVYRGSVEALPTPAVVVLAPRGVDTALLPIGGRHAVAVLRREKDGTLIIADPFAGTQRWPAHQLQSLWTGNAFCLSRPE